jgi:hypothetical protein
MSEEPKIEFRYQPRYCTFLQRQVWAILTRQPGGEWRVVNCLDKDEHCFRLDCAFTTDHGEWPYDEANAPSAATAPPDGSNTS